LANYLAMFFGDSILSQDGSAIMNLVRHH